MSPREIEVHIEELVLHGFKPSSQWDICDALQTQLHALLAERGLPAAWEAGPERIDAGVAHAHILSRPSVIGTEIASAVYQGGAR